MRSEEEIKAEIERLKEDLVYYGIHNLKRALITAGKIQALEWVLGHEVKPKQ